MDKFIPSIVRILKPNSEDTSGTGFLISQEGLIITCTHVIVKDGEILKYVDVIFMGNSSNKRLKGELVFYKNLNEGDFAIIKINEVPDGIIALKMAKFVEGSETRFNTYGFPSVVNPTGLIANGTIKLFKIPNSLYPFEILQLSSSDITKGFSGGPVIEERSELVVGIVSTIVPKDKYDRLANVAFAIPSDEIEKKYDKIELTPNYPADNGQLKLGESIVKKIKRLKGTLKINILIAASIPNGPFDVNNDKAVVQDYINKILIETIFRGKFEVTLFNLIDFDKVEIISSSNPEEVGKIITPCPDYGNLNLVIWILWHNMGYLAENSKTMEDELNSFTKSKFLIYRRNEKLTTEINDDPYDDLISNYKSTNDYFDKRSFLNVRDYEKESFDVEFEFDFRRFLYFLLSNQDNNGEKTKIGNVSNPFKGLHAYTKDDAYLFVGRIRQVDDLIYKIKEMNQKGILIILGASGSGKSSLVRAGLFYRLLTLDAIPGSKKWKVIELEINKIEVEYFIKESIDPIIKKLGDISGKEKAQMREQIMGKGNMEEIASRILAENAPNGKIIFFVDQFEELFTLIKNETEKKQFIDLLVKIAKSEKFILLLAMRSDYYHKCAEYADFQKALQNMTYTVLQPDEPSLQRIITYPVHASGLRFEDESLPLQILKDINTSAGILPLLSYAMYQLVENKNFQNILTKVAYKNLGGIAGIVERQAEVAIGPFKERQGFKKNFSFIFRKLIAISENDEPTKKTAVFEQEKWNDDSKEMLSALIEHRLLFIDEHEKGISITHEALLNNWSALRDWISIAKSDLLLLKRVEITASEWMKERNKVSDKLSILRIDHRHLWLNERLKEVKEAMIRLDFDIATDVAIGNQDAFVQFIRPEMDWLIAELEIPEIGHQRRAEIGDRLAEIGDRRNGIGLSLKKLPDIVWCKVNPCNIVVHTATETKNKSIEAPFFIAKFPITLLQFNSFTSDILYNDSTFWEGLDIDDSDKNVYQQNGHLNRPACFVSWFQSVAFCRWLTKCYQKEGILSSSENVTLPTEWQWIAAACGGKNNFNYPWGEKWDSNFASNSEGIRQFVAVGLYPNGKSPTGAMDMSGNMYEWCLNEYENIENIGLQGNKPRTTKGGAWFAFKASGDANIALKIHSRLSDNPKGLNEVGARIAVSIRPICAQPPKGSIIEDLNNSLSIS